MDCNSCREKRAEPVPYIVHEGAMARQERTIKRLWILVILIIVLLVGTNAGWIWYESQFETVETWQDVEQTADGNGINRFIGGDYYGYDTENSDIYTEESP